MEPMKGKREREGGREEERNTMGIRSLEFESQFLLAPDDCADTSSPSLDRRNSLVLRAGRG